MPQVAQQDYFVISIQSTNLSAEEKRTIAEKVEAGIILDCVLSYSGTISRILSYDKTSKLLFFSDATIDGAIASIDYNE